MSGHWLSSSNGAPPGRCSSCPDAFGRLDVDRWVATVAKPAAPYLSIGSLRQARS